MSVKLSILALSPVNDTETATEAFQHTIELAKKAPVNRYAITASQETSHLNATVNSSR